MSKYLYCSFLDGSLSLDDTKLLETAFDELPIIEDYSTMYAHFLLQELVEDKNQPLTRRFEAANLVYKIALDQQTNNIDLKSFFAYGHTSTVASMVIDGFKIRCQDGTFTIIERDFMTYVYEEALKILNNEL